MNLVCFDLEGTLAPEIWTSFADAAGIPELRLTTRDEPDFDKLMRMRVDALAAHGCTVDSIQETVATLEPFEGARAFLDRLRPLTSLVVVSDTFTQLAVPLMRKLGWPAIFCNELMVDEAGAVTGWKMRAAAKKEEVVRQFQNIGCETICAGDGFNDVGMIRASKAGFLFRTTPELAAANPDIPALETYDDLFDAIVGAL
ncbi:MAG: bifunctional phosphoserine phosphatase/homoserine phosphotransferase ThrH [Eggerthellaceae bacterium]|jgi:phosphoserine/homoserine phosphotransferase|nr:bifunctional phosphoserine phosphatase/homoserine phosphotransferase ThrH [Eggerthellaceae bacterium]